jgi:hypothetical protein
VAVRGKQQDVGNRGQTGRSATETRTGAFDPERIFQGNRYDLNAALY